MSFYLKCTYCIYNSHTFIICNYVQSLGFFSSTYIQWGRWRALNWENEEESRSNPCKTLLSNSENKEESQISAPVKLCLHWGR